MLRVIAYFFQITLKLASIHGSNKISFILFESSQNLPVRILVSTYLERAK